MSSPLSPRDAAVPDTVASADAPPHAEQPVLTRRTAVKLAAAGIVGAGFGAGGSALLTHAGGSTAPKYRFFTETEASLVIELCEQIIPRDDTPGATDAGVIHYIDRQVSTRLAQHQLAYREGLQAFARSCEAAHKAPFEKLPVADKIAFMKRVESGKAPEWSAKSVQQQSFFRMLVDHTMQGFYGSPKHGGNRDYVSYRMLGLDFPQVIGRNRHPRT